MPDEVSIERGGQRDRRLVTLVEQPDEASLARLWESLLMNVLDGVQLLRLDVLDLK